MRARYGLRGVRLGEASHPGPPKLVLRGVPRQNSSQAVDPTLLDALEEDLSDTQEDPQSAMSQVIELDESDRETVVASEMGAEAEEDPPTVQDEDVAFREISQRVLREAFASLDSVNVEEDFVTDEVAPEIPPRCTPIHNANRPLRSRQGKRREGHHGQVRAWKLFLLLPRILLFRPPRGGFVQKSRLFERFQLFSAGRWVVLLEASRECANQAAVSSRRRRRRRDQGTSLQARADRAQTLIQLGELSAARFGCHIECV